MATKTPEALRTAVLRVLFRAIHSYSATSTLAAISVAAPKQLTPIFQNRTDRALQDRRPKPGDEVSGGHFRCRESEPGPALLRYVVKAP